MSLAQTILMASIMTVSGGMLLVSDDLTKLDEERIQLLHQSLEISSQTQGKTPIPVGLFKNKFPRGMWNPAGYLGIWNPTDQEEIVSIDAPIPDSMPKLKDLWTKEAIPYSREWEKNKEVWKFPMKPFQSYVFSI